LMGRALLRERSCLAKGHRRRALLFLRYSGRPFKTVDMPPDTDKVPPVAPWK
jgi:hypothetical protein